MITCPFKNGWFDEVGQRICGRITAVREGHYLIDWDGATRHPKDGYWGDNGLELATEEEEAALFLLQL